MAVTDSTASSKIKKRLESDREVPIRYTPDEALALYIDGDLTKHSYKLLQASAKGRNCNIYPAYDVLLSAKENVIHKKSKSMNVVLKFVCKKC